MKAYMPALGKRSKHGKAFKQAFLYRLVSPSLLGLVELQDFQSQGDTYPIVAFRLPPKRARVIERLLSNVPSTQKNEGAIALISDHEGSEFIVSRKDNLHPISEFRNQLALLGGGVEEDDPLDTIVRELYEEIVCVPIADEIVDRLKFAGTHVCTFQRAGFDFSIPQSLFVTKADTQEQFASWKEAIVGPIGLSEANAEVLTFDQLLEATLEDEFIAGLSKLIILHYISKRA